MKTPKRTQFRDLTMTDTIKLYEIYSDKEAMKYRGSKPMQTIQDAENYVRNQKINRKNILTIRKGIELVRTKELIGSVMYRFDENKAQECEIGYSIGRQFWGQGLGKEIVSSMVSDLEKGNKINTIVAWSNHKNIASIKILEKIGFKRIEQIENRDNDFYCKTKS